MVDYLIIGADAAGLSAAVQILRNSPHASLKVINKGTIISYGACGIPYVISRDISSPDKLIHFTPESIKARKGIHVEINKEAIDIHPQSHTATIKNLETGKTHIEEYRKLLIATGAEPKKLPSIDNEQTGIFNIHNIPDLLEVLSYLDDTNPRRAAIIGAGNIGLEIAEAVHKRGLEVILFEVLESPAPAWSLSIQDAVLKKAIEKKIGFFGNTSVRSIEKKHDSFSISTENGERFEADLIFTVVGIKPATDFCKNSLNRMENGAITIDRTCQTSEEDIYAAGDCASAYHKILDKNVYLPLGSTANKLGRIAGINMSGKVMEFQGIIGTQIFKFFELSLARTGLSLKEAKEADLEVESFSARRQDKAGYYPGAGKAWVEIICKKNSGIIIGASAICEDNAAHYIDTAAAAIHSGLTIQELAWLDVAYAPPFAPVWNALTSAAMKGAQP
jgi:NADPH-dependent 2,4-dienoyl-CoA reductase/sulfur reductase-like enzyme